MPFRLDFVSIVIAITQFLVIFALNPSNFQVHTNVHTPFFSGIMQICPDNYSIFQAKTGERVMHDLSPINLPAPIRRAKMLVVGTKMVMDVRWSATQIFDIYQFRLRWSEPYDWNDNLNETNRRYELQCNVTDMVHGASRRLLDLRVNWLYNGYYEKYRFPPDLDLMLDCRVRPVNSAGLASRWTSTNTIRVQQVPIYFPGVEGINLRGLSHADIVGVLEKIAVVSGSKDNTSLSTIDAVTISNPS